MAEAVWVERPLDDGLWIDETGIVWSVYDGVIHTANRGTDEQWIFRGPVQRLAVDTGWLEGATQLPAENAAADAVGEFAAQWNAMRADQRERWFDAIRSNADWAYRCFIANHDGRVERQQKLLDAKLITSAKLQTEIADRVLIRWGVDLSSEHGRQVHHMVMEALQVVSRG